MPVTNLQRMALQPLYEQAWRQGDAHPGLLIQRGLRQHDSQDAEAKTEHVRRICAIPASDFYHRAFHRWRAATNDQRRFRVRELTIASRLFIGQSADGMLETGCAISHSYGVPYIPGSSVKGAVRAYAGATEFWQANRQICDDLFGTAPKEAHPDGLAGLFLFHDAWWIPGSAERPLVQEVVTSHHLEYYGSDGKTPATDLDSPIPNAQIAVHGMFLFVIEGPPAWTPLAEEMLVAALTDAGLGAKRRAGYGYFRDLEAVGTAVRCTWVDDTIARLMQQNRAKEDDTLRSKALASEWEKIEDAELKHQALEAIRARWQASGWWDEPPGRSRQAKDIYAKYAEENQAGEPP